MRRNRAVSTTLSYTLTLSISALLISGLLLAGGDYVDDRRDAVVEDELTVIGQQLAAGLERADRLTVAADSTDPTVRVTQTFPTRVTGAGYRVTLDESQEQFVLEGTDTDIRVTVGFANRTAIAESTAEGGEIMIAYDQSNDALVIDDV